MLFHNLSRLSLFLSVTLALGCSAGSDTVPEVSKIDKTHRTLKITPDSGTAKIGTDVLFTLAANPALPKKYTVAWTIDAEPFTRVNIDTISNVFRALGKHALKAVYIDSTGSRRDSTTTTITTIDTTSANTSGWAEFVVLIDNDTLDRAPFYNNCSADALYS